MNFQKTSTHTALYQAAALLQYNNPHFTAARIQELLGVDTQDDKHSVDLGCWKAKKVLGITRGYAAA